MNRRDIRELSSMLAKRAMVPRADITNIEIGCEAERCSIVRELATFFAERHANFDPVKFLQAAKVGP